MFSMLENRNGKWYSAMYTRNKTYYKHIIKHIINIKFIWLKNCIVLIVIYNFINVYLKIFNIKIENI